MTKNRVSLVILVSSLILMVGLAIQRSYQDSWNLNTSLLSEEEKLQVQATQAKMREIKGGDFILIQEGEKRETQVFCVETADYFGVKVLAKDGSKKSIDIFSPRAMFDNWQRVRKIVRRDECGWEAAFDWFWIQ